MKKNIEYIIIFFERQVKIACLLLNHPKSIFFYNMEIIRVTILCKVWKALQHISFIFCIYPSGNIMNLDWTAAARNAECKYILPYPRSDISKSARQNVNSRWITEKSIHSQDYNYGAEPLAEIIDKPSKPDHTASYPPHTTPTSTLRSRNNIGRQSRKTSPHTAESARNGVQWSHEEDRQ